MNLKLYLLIIFVFLFFSLVYGQSKKFDYVLHSKSNVKNNINHQIENQKLINLKSDQVTTATSLNGKSSNELKNKLSWQLIKNLNNLPSSLNVKPIKYFRSSSARQKFNHNFKPFKPYLTFNSKNMLAQKGVNKTIKFKHEKKGFQSLSPSLNKSKLKHSTSRGRNFQTMVKMASEKDEVAEKPQKFSPELFRSQKSFNEDYEDPDYNDYGKYMQRGVRYDEEQNEKTQDYDGPLEEYAKPTRSQYHHQGLFIKGFDEAGEDNFDATRELKKMRELEQGVEYGVEALAEKQAENQIERGFMEGVLEESYEQGADGYSDTENDNERYSQPYSLDYGEEDNYVARQKASFNNFFKLEPRPYTDAYWNNQILEMNDRDTSGMKYMPKMKW